MEGVNSKSIPATQKDVFMHMFIKSHFHYAKATAISRWVLYTFLATSLSKETVAIAVATGFYVLWFNLLACYSRASTTAHLQLHTICAHFNDISTK